MPKIKKKGRHAKAAVKRTKTTVKVVTEVRPQAHRQGKGRMKRISGRYDRLRRRYPEVHGKVVDFISHGIQDGTLYFTVRYRCDMLVVGADLCDVKTGDLKVIREYMKPKSKV